MRRPRPLRQYKSSRLLRREVSIRRRPGRHHETRTSIDTNIFMLGNIVDRLPLREAFREEGMRASTLALHVQ